VLGHDPRRGRVRQPGLSGDPPIALTSWPYEISCEWGVMIKALYSPARLLGAGCRTPAGRPAPGASSRACVNQSPRLGVSLLNAQVLIRTLRSIAASACDSRRMLGTGMKRGKLA